MANELLELKKLADYCAAHWMEGDSHEWKLRIAQLHRLCTILGPQYGVREPYDLYATFATRRAQRDDWDTIRALVWARNILGAVTNFPAQRTPEEEAIVDEQLARA